MSSRQPRSPKSSVHNKRRIRKLLRQPFVWRSLVARAQPGLQQDLVQKARENGEPLAIRHLLNRTGIQAQQKSARVLELKVRIRSLNRKKEMITGSSLEAFNIK